MFKTFQAETEKVTRQAQALLRMPALSWLQHIQAELEIIDPNSRFERLLSGMLEPNAETVSSDVSPIPVRASHKTAMSQDAQARAEFSPSVRVRHGTTIGAAQQQVTAHSFSQAAPTTADVTEREHRPSRIISDMRGNANRVRTTNTQGTRLLTEFNELQSLLRALPRTNAI